LQCEKDDVIRSVYESGRENASDVFTKVNRGGFREIRTGVGRAVKTRTDARGME